LLSAQDVVGFVGHYQKAFEAPPGQPSEAWHQRNRGMAKCRRANRTKKHLALSKIPLLQMVICRNALGVLEKLIPPVMKGQPAASGSGIENKSQVVSALPDFHYLVNESWDNGVTPLMCVSE